MKRNIENAAKSKEDVMTTADRRNLFGYFSLIGSSATFAKKPPQKDLRHLTLLSVQFCQLFYLHATEEA
jgi:hypothetical protein